MGVDVCKTTVSSLIQVVFLALWLSRKFWWKATRWNISTIILSRIAEFSILMHRCYYNISTIDEHLCLSPWELGTKPVQMTVMWYDWKLYGLLNRLQGAIMSAVSLVCDLMTQKNNVTVRLEHSMWPNVYGEQSYCYNTQGHLNRHVFRHFWVYCGEPHPQIDLLWRKKPELSDPFKLLISPAVCAQRTLCLWWKTTCKTGARNWN